MGETVVDSSYKFKDFTETYKKKNVILQKARN